MIVRVCILLVIAFAALFLWGMARHRRVYRASTPQRWPSVRQLQRAASGLAMASLLERLGERGRSAFREALRIDSQMIVPGYVGFLVFLSALTIRPVRESSSGALESMGVAAASLAAALALLAGVLDLVENRAFGRVLGSWREVPMPETTDEDEAADRQELRRQLVGAIDAPSRASAAACTWKLRATGLVLAWLLVAGVVTLTECSW